MAIENWLAENYEGLVADENRNFTFEAIAEDAEKKNSPELAAWAREKAAGKKKDVTPRAGKPAPAKSKR